MAARTPRPVIFPLSNPTSKAEAEPQDIIDWTDGMAVVGTGSPFPPVRRGGREVRADQTNNSYIFPGVALGTIAVQARRINDETFLAAAKALADLSPARSNPSGQLLPPVESMRDISIAVARAVALEARRQGMTRDLTDDQIEAAIRSKMWKPVYHHYRRVTPAEDVL
jgi:malate dehydrogenase (oxaloacetate-decarboxylating)